jgi:hypothetical protein
MDVRERICTYHHRGLFQRDLDLLGRHSFLFWGERYGLSNTHGSIISHMRPIRGLMWHHRVAVVGQQNGCSFPPDQPGRVERLVWAALQLYPGSTRRIYAIDGGGFLYFYLIFTLNPVLRPSPRVSAPWTTITRSLSTCIREWGCRALWRTLDDFVRQEGRYCRSERRESPRLGTSYGYVGLGGGQSGCFCS